MASPYYPDERGSTAGPGHASATGPNGADAIVVSVRFTANAHQVAMRLAKATHVTPSELFRDALSVYWWLAREHGQGHCFLVRRGNRISDLILPSLEGMDPLPEEEPPGPPPDERHSPELEAALLEALTEEGA